MLPGETILSGADPVCDECGVRPEFEVLQSAAGFYIGTRCHCGPYSRETGYYRTFDEAKQLLDSGKWKEQAR